MKHTITEKAFLELTPSRDGNPRYYVGVRQLSDVPYEQIKKAGGKAYRGKRYGAGYVFTTYRLDETRAELSPLPRISVKDFTKLGYTENGNPKFFLSSEALGDKRSHEALRSLDGKLSRSKQRPAGYVFQSYNLHNLTLELNLL